MAKHLCTIVWDVSENASLDYCTWTQTETGYHVGGVLITSHDNRPMRIDYQVLCDAQWHTRQVEVDLTSGVDKQSLRLTVDENQRWWHDGAEISACRGCLDVDLNFSPATNTLPIRRLNLAIGESGAVTAAWVKFPGLEVEPLSQQYTRLTDQQYRYQSFTTRFEATLAVNALGIVTNYQDYWRAVAVVEG